MIPASGQLTITQDPMLDRNETKDQKEP